MSIDVDGLQFCAALLRDGTIETIRRLGITEDLVRDDAVPVLRFIRKYATTYGKLPDLDTANKETGRNLAPESHLANSPVEFYAKKLRNRRLLRIIGMGAADSVELLEANEVDKAYERMQRVVIEGRDHSEDAGAMFSMETSGEERWEWYLKAEASVDGIEGIETPWPEYDRLTGGYRDGDFHLKVGRPGLGKTWAICVEAVFALRNNDEHDGPVLIVEPEMPIDQLAQRLDAIDFKLPHGDLRRSMLGTTEKLKYKNVLHAEPGDKDLLIAAPGTVNTIDDIEGLIREYKPSIVFVDGIYLLGDPRMREQDRTTQNSRMLKRVAAATESKIVGVVQFNRDTLKRRDGKGELENLGQADALGQDASSVVALWQDDDMRKEKIMLFRMIKNRVGERTDFVIRWDFEQMDFSLLSNEIVDEENAAQTGPQELAF